MRHLSLASGLCAIALMASAPASAAPSHKQTLANLHAAYNGESNAKAKYTDFALKADQEGYKGVAALFRAAALSEGIHAKSHANVIKKLGGKANATLAKVEVKSTKENIEVALAGETHEKEKMYPDFIKAAEEEKQGAAVASFKRAMAAEVEHAKLYKDALDNMEAWKAPKAFAVCLVCGYTETENPNLTTCPVCMVPKEKFKIVK